MINERKNNLAFILFTILNVIICASTVYQVKKERQKMENVFIEVTTNWKQDVDDFINHAEYFEKKAEKFTKELKQYKDEAKSKD